MDIKRNYTDKRKRSSFSMNNICTENDPPITSLSTAVFTVINNTDYIRLYLTIINQNRVNPPQIRYVYPYGGMHEIEMLLSSTSVTTANGIYLAFKGNNYREMTGEVRFSLSGSLVGNQPSTSVTVTLNTTPVDVFTDATTMVFGQAPTI